MVFTYLCNCLGSTIILVLLCMQSREFCCFLNYFLVIIFLFVELIKENTNQRVIFCLSLQGKEFFQTLGFWILLKNHMFGKGLILMVIDLLLECESFNSDFSMVFQFWGLVIGWLGRWVILFYVFFAFFFVYSWILPKFSSLAHTTI